LNERLLTAAETRLNELIEPLDLGQSSSSKFDELRRYLAEQLGLAEGDLYVCGSSVRASNLPIRLVQGKARDKHHRLGLAVLGTDELPLATGHARNLANGTNYDAVAVAAKIDGRWTIPVIARRDDRLSDGIKELFPDVDVIDGVTPAGVVNDQPTETKAGDLPLDSLTLELVKAECDERRMILDDEPLLTALAAIRSGKNVIFTGPPGTGKTTVAEAFASAAMKVGVSTGYVPTTGTSDWTSADTVGAYRMIREGGLRFQPGLFLDAIDRQAWLVIDELNRADIDKAIGPIFTVLSGRTVVLPYREETDSGESQCAILPEGETASNGTHAHVVGQNWRILATLNDRDQDLLFELSQAFIRRFAIVPVPVPSPPLYRQILEKLGRTGSATLDERIYKLTSIPGVPLGPAIVLDCARFLRDRLAVAADLGIEVDEAALLRSAITAFVEPQLGHLAEAGRAHVQAHIDRLYAVDGD
jgi:MoxR-like ATPase